MTDKKKKHLQKFYQSSMLSSEMAIHMLQNKRDYDAIRMLWEAYSFSSDEQYLEKIAIVYSVVGGAEEESLNILLRLFAKRPKAFSKGKEMLILSALQYRMRLDGVSLSDTPKEKRKHYIEFIENWAEAVGIKAEINEIENFYIVKSKDLRNNKLLKQGVMLLESKKFAMFDEFVKGVIYNPKTQDLEFLVTHFLYESLQFKRAFKTSLILIEELVKISDDNAFALVSVFSIMQQKNNINFNFDLENLSVNVVRNLIETNEEQKLADALIAFPNDTRFSKSINEGIDFLMKSPNHTISKIHAIVRHLLINEKWELANEHLKMGLTLYPRCPIFKLLKWVFERKINPGLLYDYSVLSKKLTLDLLKEIEKFQTYKLSGESNKSGNNSINEIVENRFFLERLIILFYLGNNDNVNIVLNRLFHFSNSRIYFDFLLQELSSVYYSTYIKMSIYSAIQNINQDFSGNVIILFDDDILHKKISSVKFDISDINYFSNKKLYAKIAESFLFIDINLNSSLLKNIIINLYKIIQEEELNIDPTTIFYVVLYAYLEFDKRMQILEHIVTLEHVVLDKARKFFNKYTKRLRG